jgi:hypothetical protein
MNQHVRQRLLTGLLLMGILASLFKSRNLLMLASYAIMHPTGADEASLQPSPRSRHVAHLIYRTTPSFSFKPSDYVQSIMGKNGLRQKEMLQPIVAAAVEGKTSSLRSKVSLDTVPHHISNDDDDAVDIEASNEISREQTSMKAVEDDALISNGSEQLKLSTTVGMMTPTNLSSTLQ